MQTGVGRAPASTPTGIPPLPAIHPRTTAPLSRHDCCCCAPARTAGVYIRNTENPAFDSMDGNVNYHPFDGDAMLHAIRFRGGKASYRNKFVRTKGFEAEQARAPRAPPARAPPLPIHAPSSPRTALTACGPSAVGGHPRAAALRRLSGLCSQRAGGLGPVRAP